MSRHLPQWSRHSVSAALVGMFAVFSVEAVTALAEASPDPSGKSAGVSTVLTVTVLPAPPVVEATSTHVALKGGNSEAFKTCQQLTLSTGNVQALQCGSAAKPVMAPFHTASSLKAMAQGKVLNGVYTVTNISY